VIVGSAYLFFSKQNKLTRIPFGPFLALGAIAYFFFEQKIVWFFWG
jgi:prepilin signal peptidase PulO-like enzyme (type II secretory pathway)